MKKVSLLTLAVMFGLCNLLTAANITEQSAKTVAINFYKLNAHNIDSRTAVTAILKFTKTEEDGTIDFYAFDINPKGFVIVTADDNIEPVIAYSTESYFNANPRGHVGVSYWMNQTAAKVVHAKTEGLIADARITNLWSAYQNGQNPGINKATTVGPLTTSTWDQENDLSNPPPYIYNLYCPFNTTDNQRAVTGCVATAMAQIMYYWKYPATGSGSYSYSYTNPTTGDVYNYGTMSANFGATTYAWANMPNALTLTTTGAQDSAVDLLSYHTGVSVAMEYGDDKQGGSGAWVLQNDAGTGNPCAQHSYVTYFGYNPSTIQGVYASSYTTAAWATLLENELNASRVIEYAGYETNGGGHTWVCDGYETSPSTMFHMNWGWQGIDNGYYAIGALNPSPYAFNSNDEALIGIQPNNVASCGVPTGSTAGGITNTGATLTWTVVSGAVSYSLEWKASSASTWTTVTGLTSPTYTLAGLTACTTYQFAVNATCSSATSAYSSAASFTTTGCVAPTYCASTGTTTAREYIKNVKLGTINTTTASGTAGYINNTATSTTLAAGSTYTISLTPGFVGSSRQEYFTVYIDYNQSGVFTEAGEIVAEANGRSAVSKSFRVPTTSKSGTTRMRIQMQYNSYETNSCATFANGQVQDFTVNITGGTGAELGDNMAIENVSGNQIMLYPNPAQNNVTVQFASDNEGSVKMNVYNITGQKVIAQENPSSIGQNTQSINTQLLSNGVYIFEIEKNGVLQRQKFIISK